MRAEALSALVVATDDAVCQGVAEGLRWVGADRVVRVRSGQSAQAEITKKRFVYSVVVIHIQEDVSYDVGFIETLLHSRDLAFRSMPVVAVAQVRTREFLSELHKLGFKAVFTLPLNRILLRNSLVKIFGELQSDYRSPDPKLLRRALSNGDVDFVEERSIRALRHQPHDPVLKTYLGEVYFRQGKIAEALALATEAVSGSEDVAPIDAQRLMAKVLFKMGKVEDAFNVLPYLVKDQGQDRPAVLGLVPVLNACASHRKAAGQVEEALVYYNLALSEADARKFEHQLCLNVALAHLAGGDVRAAHVAASRSLSSSMGSFQKPLDLVRHIEANFPKEDYLPLAVGAPSNGAKGTAADRYGSMVGRHKNRRFDADDGDDLDGEGRGSEAVLTQSSAGQELGMAGDLTEELDFPEGATPPPRAPAQQSQKSSVLAAMGRIGQDGFDGLDLDGEVERPEATIDTVGEDLDVTLDLSADDLDFEVSKEALDASRARREPAAELALETMSDNAGMDFSQGEDPFGSELGSALSDALGSDSFGDVGNGLDSVSDGTLALAGGLGGAVASGTIGQKDRTLESVSKESATPSGESRRIKWESMTEDKILTFLMYEGEYPPIKVKPLKFQVNRKFDAVTEEFQG
jgi:tetratricopeptide (TPR) repeat protein